MNQMNVQQAADLTVEIDSTTFDAGAKKCTLTHLKHLAFQTKAVGMYQPSNPDTVTNFDFFHGSP